MLIIRWVNMLIIRWVNISYGRWVDNIIDSRLVKRYICGSEYNIMSLMI
jgi:hypothetical protein